MAATPDLDQLLLQVSSRDHAAFRRLYDLSASQVFGVLLRILPRRDIAEEALQDVFIRVWEEAASYRESRGKAMAWITTIARNRALDIRRRLGREFPLDEEAVNQVPDTATPDTDPERFTQWGDEAERLQHCMDELSTDQSGSIRLAFLRGYSHSEVADAVGAPIGTVKSWIRRGLAALKACVER